MDPSEPVKFVDRIIPELKTWVINHLPEIAGRLLVAVVVLLATWAAASLAARVVRRLLVGTPGVTATTLAPSASSVAKGAVMVLGMMAALDQLGLDIKALLAGAGVLGLAVGFGAQSLVKDWLSGFFLIFDGVVKKDDLLEVQGHLGIVEEVGLRMTRVRSYDGVLWYVPNGQVDIVGNSSRAWRRFIVDVGVAYEGDVGAALRVLGDVGRHWYEDNKEVVALEEPEVLGTTGLNASDVGLRLAGKVAVDEVRVYAVEREVRQLVKEAFDAEGIEIPFPRRVVYHRTEEEHGALEVNVTDASQAA